MSKKATAQAAQDSEHELESLAKLAADTETLAADLRVAFDKFKADISARISKLEQAANVKPDTSGSDVVSLTHRIAKLEKQLGVKRP